MRVTILRKAAALGAAAALLSAWAAPAGADMVLATDGKWWPEPTDRSAPVPGPEEEPSDEQLVAGETFKVDATYETVKAGSWSRPAGMVLKIRSTAGAQNEDFRRARNDAANGALMEAADEFGQAAAALTGMGKQEALWSRAQVLADWNAEDKVLAAIDDLLTAFPKSFYYGEAQALRAKIAARKGDSGGAAKALASVAAAPGMNPRDVLRAEYLRIFLTLESAKKYDEALGAYLRLVESAGKVDSLMSDATKLQALVGAGNCFLAMKKEKEAGDAFLKATASHNPDVLAGAYSGLGDIALTDAKGLRDAGKLREAKDRLEDAALHYLRVTIKYASDVNDPTPVLRALGNQGRVFTLLFEVTGSKDLGLLEEALKTYWSLYRDANFKDGPEKRSVTKMLRDLDDKKKELLAKPPAPPPQPPAEKPK